MRRLIIMITILSCAMAIVPTALAASSITRIKDVAKVQGVRANQLVGYGLVTGLAGTGDSNTLVQTRQSIANMLKSFGLTVSDSQLKSKNVAAVMVTAQLPAFVKPGDTIDMTISSMGDAKSLQGGILLQTPLKAANGQVYAVGQGPVSTGGYSASGGGSSQQKNFPTTGTTPNGAIVEREVPSQLISPNGSITLALSQPDFTTAARIGEAINNRFGPISTTRDPGTVVISVPSAYDSDVVGFVASIEELYINPDTIAKIIINERTGTIVMGSNVTIDEVAVAQGGLSVRIDRTTDVSQPPPFSGGSTVVTNNTSVDVKEDKANVMVLPSTASVGDVVNALNAIGATPRDIISILQAMKASGALHADLQII
ncbi:flagellar basal body P-ring protein FlgI [Pelosinus propionicus]|uniref:Flagellar P-ring protein n=1 Tax=Pelosinus propionicus DSM 13327 TaxID=1123291 RepID=A0A1I4J879_9FIRM|nr:flagellar basal body P-ring protein FlgI [Pelosinus propionicus]SFL62427.1 flagellar P-ring protein precursor FlgI [Pelosinus propionicus DSM 13327]